ARSGACDVEEMALGVVDLLQIGVVAHGLNALLQRHDFIIAGDHRHGSELQAFGQMHCADRYMARGGLDVLVKNLEGKFRCPNSTFGASELSWGTNKHAE